MNLLTEWIVSLTMETKQSPSTDAAYRERLAIAHLATTKACARDVYRQYRHIDIDDLEGESLFALARALRFFVPGSGKNFGALVFEYVRRRLTAFVDAEADRQSRHQSIAGMDQLRDDRCRHKDIIDDRVRLVLDSLSETDRTLIEARFFGRKTLEELAVEYSVSHQAIAQRIERLLKRTGEMVGPQL